jgi:diaminopimelate decarboxylase
MYGAYHHITVLGKRRRSPYKKIWCYWKFMWKRDKFATNRFLPEIQEGDLLAIHNAGAHGRAMWFNIMQS